MLSRLLINAYFIYLKTHVLSGRNKFLTQDLLCAQNKFQSFFFDSSVPVSASYDEVRLLKNPDISWPAIMKPDTLKALESSSLK